MAEGDVGTFSRRLADLKEEGSLVLVVGNDARSRSSVSRHLLGHRGEKRIPIFVLLGRGRSVIEDRLREADPVDENQIIEYGFHRSASISSQEPSAPTDRRLESLDNLLDEIVVAVETVANQHDDPLAPGELRICVDSMTLIIDGFEREAVEEYLADFRNVVTTHAGMAHLLLPLTTVPERYDWLESKFDAVIETRTVDGVPHERWRIADAGQITEWFPVEDGSAG